MSESPVKEKTKHKPLEHKILTRNVKDISIRNL